jgi:hypothetical protein
MSLKEFFDSFEDSCEPGGTAHFRWSAKGCGFGEMYFYLDKSDGYVHCDNELMGREFLKEMLCKMVDNCVLNLPGSFDTTGGLPPNYTPKPVVEEDEGEEFVELKDDTDSPPG